MGGILIVLDYFVGLFELFINYIKILFVCIWSLKYLRDVFII